MEFELNYHNGCVYIGIIIYIGFPEIGTEMKFPHGSQSNSPSRSFSSSYYYSYLVRFIFPVQTMWLGHHVRGPLLINGLSS